MAQSDPRPFINTTPLKEPDHASRRNARSYVMRGKNTGKRRKHLIKRPSLGSWINKQFPVELCQDPDLLPHELACTYRVPRQVGSEWTLFQFAEEISPYIREKISKCMF
jgi:hypothetical protein